MVAAATDYWFTRPDRAAACRVLVGGFPVRRSGGGSADLTTADDLLAAGHDIIIYPEGTRTRDGSIGEFRSGAARLAARPALRWCLLGSRDEALLPQAPAGRQAPVVRAPPAGRACHRDRALRRARLHRPVFADLAGPWTTWPPRRVSAWWRWRPARQHRGRVDESSSWDPSGGAVIACPRTPDNECFDAQ